MVYLKFLPILILLRPIYFIIRAVYIKTNWEKTEGVIKEAEQPFSILSLGSHYKILVSYIAEGQEYIREFTFKRTFLDDRPIIGKRENIYYDPLNPDNSKCEKSLVRLAITNSVQAVLIVAIILFYMKVFEFYMSYLDMF